MDAIDFINQIRPEHDRTSCNDKDINNGFFSRNGETWHGRCTRCMYLEIINGDYYTEDLDGFDPEDCYG